MWFGTKGGLNKYDRTSGLFSHYKYDKYNPNSLSGDWVVDILEDRQGMLWIGSRGGGLNKFDINRNQFTHYRYDADDDSSISSDLVMNIIEDAFGELWVVTWGGGINRFDRRANQFVRYRNDKDNPQSLSDDYVMSSYKDSAGDLWFGTFGGGLNKYNAQTDAFSHFREKDGLVNDTVYGILEDDDKNLWLSTNRGLSKFNHKTGKFKNYNDSDGLQSNEFNGGSYFRSDNGELFFGGINGFNRFDPKNIKDDIQPPKVVLTDFLLFNQSVPVQSVPANNLTQHSDFILPRAIDQLPHLTLGYKQNLVTFEFAALDFANPLKNQYDYKLQGLDTNWIKADARIRRATYTNLPSGDYTLLVRASNPDGYWNQTGASIKLHVEPPPWRSWWAYVLYFLLSSMAILKVIYFRIERGKVRNERMMLHHLKQVDKLKDDFLANTSHELRTPLNGIIGLAESLIDGIDGELPTKAKKSLAMVVTSGRRLASLINDILDLSKLKHSGIELHRQPVDVCALTDVVLTLSKPLVGDKSLVLINEVPENIALVEADENRLLQILHNLVGNGIKFTENGNVTVSAVAEDNLIKINVLDSGVGICEDKFASIFDSFEQVQGDLDRAFGGTGLGLTITRQLVELHGGTIGVSSVVGEGSIFTFTLPICMESASRAMRLKTDLIESSLIGQLDEDADEAATFDDISVAEDGSQFRLLLVDDEPINIHVLKNYLSKQHYQMVEAKDGIQALEAIENDGPFDMVLLDIMMPKLSGYEVCKKIRETYSVSDLPVLFLTASTQVDDVVQGFSVGANDHLNKPVAKHELLSRVGTHLRLLDINRTLESRVNERTAQVEQQKQDLEDKNSEILATQEKLILSEKLASLGALMAGVAHEINNPTNFVTFSVENLAVDLAKCREFIFALAGDDADQEILDGFRHKFDPLDKHITIIKEGTSRLQSIVKDLNSSTYMRDNEEISVNIADTLMSTINLVSAEYKQEVELVTELSTVPEINCYPSKLSQVFMNLIVNACDALRDRKRQEQAEAKTATSTSEQGLIVIACQLVNKYIEITIKDNGCGMTQETKEKLFEPFYTTKGLHEGTGLGLAISHEIIHNHGGQLNVESELGVGTEFTIALPVS